MPLRKIGAGRVPVLPDTVLPTIPAAKLPAIPDANLPARLQDAALDADYVNKVPVDIPSGENLNAYISPGSYTQPVNEGAAAGSNYPLPKAGLLEVFVRGAATAGAYGMIWQRYTIYGESGDDGQVMFQRALYNGVWLAWEAINRITVSTSDPSGTAVEGAMWYKV